MLRQATANRVAQKSLSPCMIFCSMGSVVVGVVVGKHRRLVGELRDES